MSEPSKVIEILPALHACILAIMGAVVIAWFFYVYPIAAQKNIKAKELVLKTIHFQCPTCIYTSDIKIPVDTSGKIDNQRLYELINDKQMRSASLGGNAAYHLEDYELHLKETLFLLNEIMTTNPFYGNINYSYAPPHIDDIIIPTSEDAYQISSILSKLVFSLNVQMPYIEKIQQKINEIKNKKMDHDLEVFRKEKNQELYLRVEELTKKGTTEKQINNYIESQNHIIEQRVESKKRQFTSSFTDYRATIHEYVSKLGGLMFHYEGQIQDTIIDVEKTASRYSLKMVIPKTIQMMLFILFFGVAIPLFVLGPISSIIPWGNIFIQFMTYIVCIITIFPYFLMLSKILDYTNDL
ncbi:hypothetical protein EDF75_0794 [Raoultella sp. BIGb0149]|uniref:hypothetical protein n=1 Tax=Raoultella sp. BIGb0149 TaxID=2485116 RepID=UPI0010613AC6|nr:hypothetical protein [Raoultella sp. BIGb0149]TDQ26743.1 hypothetical protein EDF75_0794 [Raoultella sp. BIGb0149]